MYIHKQIYIYIDHLSRIPLKTWDLLNNDWRCPIFQHQKSILKPKINPTWKAIRHNKLGVVLLAGGSFRECLGLEASSHCQGQRFFFVCKTVGGGTYHITFFMWNSMFHVSCFLHFWVFRSELECNEWKCSLFFLLDFGLYPGTCIFWRWCSSGVWNWKVASSKFPNIGSQSFLFAVYFTLESEKGGGGELPQGNSFVGRQNGWTFVKRLKTWI